MLIQIFAKVIIAPTPFYRPDSHKYFECARRGETIGVLETLTKDPYLIYEYNDIGQTIFHMCCKRNMPDLLFLACRCKKGDLDARDYTGKTAVMWAYEFNYVRCLRVRAYLPDHVCRGSQAFRLRESQRQRLLHAASYQALKRQSYHCRLLSHSCM